ncbi:hypothetical protein PVT68_10420 [Microbulbifer bruguierae]|uniref:Uncharacterized protein n=1 Tax=Microbulbifer bruguierae TaxID=3029061 RepID=A0ABY8N8G8_9GAMM|nr:hypothetical protein [Microbulbifer bruguierae]WGL15188.1 hypothetical protein PVT68_10420 [Microbulbifer bruguierae]
MSLYELTRSAISLAPAMVLAISFIFLRQYTWYFRLGLLFFGGWILIAGSTYIFWTYSINYAPDQEILAELSRRDGAPRLLGVLFGWAYAIVVYFILESFRLLFIGLRSINQEK